MVGSQHPLPHGESALAEHPRNSQLALVPEQPAGAAYSRYSELNMAKVVGVTVGVIVMAALTWFYALLLAAVGGFGVPPSVVFDRVRHTPVPIMIPALWQLLWPLLGSLFIAICCGLPSGRDRGGATGAV